MDWAWFSYKNTRPGPNDPFDLHLLVRVTTSQRGSPETIYEDSGEIVGGRESPDGGWIDKEIERTRSRRFRSNEV